MKCSRSGKALAKELGKARAMTGILAALSAEIRTKGVALIQQADRLLCESWNERMWSDRQAGSPTNFDDADSSFDAFAMRTQVTI